MEQNTRWSLKYSCCVKCGGKEAKHIARGLCVYCYNAEANEKNRIRQRNKYGLATEKLNYEYLHEEYVIKEKSLEDIAKDINCSRQFVYKKLKAFNIPLRTKQKARELAYNKNKFIFKRVDETGNEKLVVYDKIHFNEKFFSSWSKEMAYVLGVIYTDGNIYPGSKLDPSRKTTVTMPRLTISQKEPELLNKVLKLMNCDAKLNYRKKLVSGEGIVSGALYWFSITNEKIYNDLIKLGLSPNKSMTMGFPNIPPEYIRHFIRGCWDGDGSIYIEKRSGSIRASYISGSLRFLESMVLELEKTGLSAKIIYKKEYENKSGKKSCSYFFRYVKKEDCRKLFHYFYEDVAPDEYLERKHEVFENYFTTLKKTEVGHSIKPKELFEMFEKGCEERNYKITEAARKKLQVIFQILDMNKDKTSLNPSIAMKIFKKAIARQADRIRGIGTVKDEMLCTIIEDDIPPAHLCNR